MQYVDDAFGLEFMLQLQQESEGEQACTMRKWRQLKGKEDEDLKIHLNICERDYLKQG